jgi:hypothetical protein
MSPVARQVDVTVDAVVHGAGGADAWSLPAEEDGVVAWRTRWPGPAPGPTVVRVHRPHEGTR